MLVHCYAHCLKIICNFKMVTDILKIPTVLYSMYTYCIFYYLLVSTVLLYKLYSILYTCIYCTLQYTVYQYLLLLYAVCCILVSFLSILHTVHQGGVIFLLFWNLKNRHLKQASGCNSKTKIEKAFFNIFSNYSEHPIFV